MSLPSETVFKCAGHSSSERDRLIVDYGNEDHLYLSTIEHGEGRADVILSKDQVKSLRDQLTAWLGDANQSKVTMKHVMKAYQMASFEPTAYLRGTSNWCAYVADVINKMRSGEIKP